MILKGKTAVITGSTSAIGLAHAKALVAEGANATINGFGKPCVIEKIRKEEIEQKFNVSVTYSAAAMTKRPRSRLWWRRRPANRVVSTYWYGIQFVSLIEEFPAEKWDQIIPINLSAAFHAIRRAVPIIKAARWERIISTASTHSLVASPFNVLTRPPRLPGPGRWRIGREVADIRLGSRKIAPGSCRTIQLCKIDFEGERR